jgi:hypothetical protein
LAKYRLVTLQKAWAEGSAMTVEQAVAYALEGRAE